MDDNDDCDNESAVRMARAGLSDTLLIGISATSHALTCTMSYMMMIMLISPTNMIIMMILMLQQEEIGNWWKFRQIPLATKKRLHLQGVSKKSEFSGLLVLPVVCHLQKSEFDTFNIVRWARKIFYLSYMGQRKL